MIWNRFSIFIKITHANIDKIKEILSKYNPVVTLAYWLKIKDMQADFYEIAFEKNMVLEEFKKVCIQIDKLSLIEEIDIYFAHKGNCLELLQDKGFKRYEETEYVDFKYPSKNVIVGLVKEELYRLKIQRLEENKPIDVPYFFNLINRVFEIVNREGNI